MILQQTVTTMIAIDLWSQSVQWHALTTTKQLVGTTQQQQILKTIKNCLTAKNTYVDHKVDTHLKGGVLLMIYMAFLGGKLCRS